MKIEIDTENKIIRIEESTIGELISFMKKVKDGDNYKIEEKQKIIIPPQPFNPNKPFEMPLLKNGGFEYTHSSDKTEL
jgi:hypothetical protein